MQKQTIKSKQEGFTIIEVLIVLAIASLILLVVFLAVPGLQRSNANNAAKNDATRIASAITSWVANNGATVPSSALTAAQVNTVFADLGASNTAKLKGGDAAAISTVIGATVADQTWYTDNVGATFDGTAAAKTYTVPAVTGNKYAVDIVTNAQCSTTFSQGNNAVPITGNSSYGSQLSAIYAATKIALFYTTSTAGNSYWNCLQVQ